jgi:predicted DNA-binding transcriptional regulator YafY
MISLIDAWIKAAVEHQTIEITYRSEKNETTVREVEPDYYGWSTNGRNFGCFGFCRLRDGNIRCFKPENILEWRYVGNLFSPDPQGRWHELMPVYQQKGLEQASF